MSGYLARLKKEKQQPRALPKLSKGVSGSFDSTKGRPIPEKQKPLIKYHHNEQGREVGFELDGPPTQPRPTVEVERPTGFDIKQWTQRISEAMHQAADQDGGSLSWCRENYPDIHAECLKSARRVDGAFEAGDEESLEDALAAFDLAHRQARELFLGADTATVRCGECRHFIRNPQNPAEGAGNCGEDMNPAYPYPAAPRRCHNFKEAI
jgi:hypothetical protein